MQWIAGNRVANFKLTHYPDFATEIPFIATECASTKAFPGKFQ